MDKSRVCVNRATSMAKQKKCAKTHLLVYEKGKECPKPQSPAYQVPSDDNQDFISNGYYNGLYLQIYLLCLRNA